MTPTRPPRVGTLIAVPARIVLAVVLALVLALPAAALDTDGDGLRDSFETRHGLTSPTNPDSDGDGVVDSAEDHDGDGLSNRGEQRSGTDPSSADTDGDGITDDAEDHDGDGRSNAREQDGRPVPDGLQPPLRRAGWDQYPDKKRCLTEHGRSNVVTCELGEPAGDIEIFLVGDSHATMYLTPFARIARDQGWKLTSMAKRACPAVPGLSGDLQWRIDKGRTCRLWQERVVSRLDRFSPDLVVLAHSPSYKLRKPGGAIVAPWKRQGRWRIGLMRMLDTLPAETTVLALGGAPRNFRGNPVKCLKGNQDDISACVSGRQPAHARAMDVGLQQAASGSRARFDSLFDRICAYDPCPVIQGDVLMWRDGSHLSETFVQQLQPSIERILLEALDIDP